MAGGKDFDKFLASVGAGSDFPQRLQVRLNTKFLLRFADGTGEVVLAGFEMAGGAGVPLGWLAIFAGRTLL